VRREFGGEKESKTIDVLCAREKEGEKATTN